MLKIAVLSHFSDIFLFNRFVVFGGAIIIAAGVAIGALDISMSTTTTPWFNS